MSTNIIKARPVPNAPYSPTIKKENHQASLKARDILADAERRALQIIAKAEHEKEEILEEARKQGYQYGLDRWNELLAQAWDLREQYLSHNEAELVRLALAVAEKIVKREIQSDSALVVHTVQEALQSVRREKHLTIQVNPAQEALVNEQANALRALLPWVRELVIVGNASITPGGCIVESDVGVVDAQIETQFAALEKALRRRSDGGGN